MQIAQRPAWPVVFLLAAVLQAQSPLAELDAEMRSWRRLRRPENPEALAALEQAREQATAEWVRRWPDEELAWRERLRALTRTEADRQRTRAALAGAERTLGTRPELRFPVDTRFLMAEAAVQAGVRSVDVAQWLEMAEQTALAALPAGEHPLVAAYRREELKTVRWRIHRVLAELAWQQGDAATLANQVIELTAHSVVAVLDPADRVAAAERARRRMSLFAWRARLARLEGDSESARGLYRWALRARPVQPGGQEPLEHGPLIAEAAELGVAAGEGTPLPPAHSAGPHWLPTAQRLPGFELDGRPAVVAVWDGDSAGIERAVERLEGSAEVRVVRLVAAPLETVRARNPLYTAAQLWIVDADGVVRLIGRLQPGGDGWEDAVTGAALRLRPDSNAPVGSR